MAEKINFLTGVAAVCASVLITRINKITIAGIIFSNFFITIVTVFIY
jgi:hypothetical protein